MPEADEDSPIALATWLASAESGPAQASAAESLERSPGDPLAASTRLRQQLPALSPAKASAALEQATLRLLVRQRYGFEAGQLLLTRAGLEQATRPEIAAHRARLVRQSGARRVVDLTAGLGFDAAAFAAAGLEVTAVERDAVTAVLLAHNCPEVRTICADALDPSVLSGLVARLDPTDVLFADPARRDPTGAVRSDLRARPERDPERWSPPWSRIASLPHPRIAAKVAPGFEVPENWRAEWTSIRRTVVECALYSWPVFEGSRRAVVWSKGRAVVIPAQDQVAAGTASDVAAFLHEPDPAVLSAGALSWLVGADPTLRLVDPSSTWLTSASDAHSEVLRSFPVVAVLEGSPTKQKRQLDALGVGALTVKSRDVDVSPRTVLRELGRTEGNGHVLVVTRRAGRTIRVLCLPARPR